MTNGSETFERNTGLESERCHFRFKLYSMHTRLLRIYYVYITNNIQKIN